MNDFNSNFPISTGPTATPISGGDFAPAVKIRTLDGFEYWDGGNVTMVLEVPLSCKMRCCAVLVNKE